MIEITGLSLQAGKCRLGDINLSVAQGQYAIITGPSGCGKTSLLECILGLRSANSGRVLANGEDMTFVRPAQRQMGYVPQDGCLFSNMTVEENVCLALKIRGWTPERIRTRVGELGELTGISQLFDRRVHFLSGGERQRVALARALSFRPTILCLDEPLTALDAESRHQMQTLLATLKQEWPVTTLHVTHDNQEAERLGDVFFEITGQTVRNRS